MLINTKIGKFTIIGIIKLLVNKKLTINLIKSLLNYKKLILNYLILHIYKT